MSRWIPYIFVDYKYLFFFLFDPVTASWARDIIAFTLKMGKLSCHLARKSVTWGSSDPTCIQSLSLTSDTATNRGEARPCSRALGFRPLLFLFDSACCKSGLEMVLVGLEAGLGVVTFFREGTSGRIFLHQGKRMFDACRDA